MLIVLVINIDDAKMRCCKSIGVTHLAGVRPCASRQLHKRIVCKVIHFHFPPNIFYAFISDYTNATGTHEEILKPAGVVPRDWSGAIWYAWIFPLFNFVHSEKALGVGAVDPRPAICVKCSCTAVSVLRQHCLYLWHSLISLIFLKWGNYIFSQEKKTKSILFDCVISISEVVLAFVIIT